jgi:hypothetical protein
MFGLNWNDPQTLWLNLTNVGLGVVTLTCVLAVGYNIARELVENRRKAAATDREMNRMLAAEGHAMHIGELGWTMADGGEPYSPKVFKTPPQAKPAPKAE